MHEALFYKKIDNNRVGCYLCQHRCQIQEGDYGICNVRQNIDGTLYTHTYARLIAQGIDPIEKKPIFHMLPGSKSFSIATPGCNFKCQFCQNWQISQKDELGAPISEIAQIKPDEVVKAALACGCKSISYTYTEPTIFFEYAYDVAKLAKSQNLLNIFVTNGYISKEPLMTILPYLDAANIDLKFFNQTSYIQNCGAHLEFVAENIKLMHKLGIWVEVTTLLIPEKNDSKEELENLANFIAQTGKEIPWHISRFHPDYKMTDTEPTPQKTLNMAYKIGKDAGLKYVYVGNVQKEENTYCSGCGGLLIRRLGFSVLENRLLLDKCPECDTILDGKALHN